MDELADLAGSAMQGAEGLGGSMLQGAEDLGGMALGGIENEASDIAGVATHGASAVGDALGGDWEGAAGEALSMSGDALGAATGGLTDLAGDAYDAVSSRSATTWATRPTTSCTAATRRATWAAPIRRPAAPPTPAWTRAPSTTA